MPNKIIYYYQTFCGLQNLLNNKNPTTHIHLSSIHFGLDLKNNPYIHLNNDDPYSEKFDKVWEELLKAKIQGIQIILMLGGAGGAYDYLFSNFNIYYAKVNYLLKCKKDIISGIDLDIEETCSLEDVKKLINQLDFDFGPNFTISMAPIQNSLQYDSPGMGGFIYKDLFKSKEGTRINYFNVQFYMDYSFSAFEQIIKNGYPEYMIVMGMESSDDLNNNLDQIKLISQKYKNFGGAFLWEYYNAPPNGSEDQSEWSRLIDKKLYNLRCIIL
jgi:hypothetical protein